MCNRINLIKDKLQLYIKGDLETMILWLTTHHGLEHTKDGLKCP